MAEQQWDFFVSYAAVDRAWAAWIAWELENAGYSVLFPEWDFVPGSHWTSQLRAGIERSTRMLAVLSEQYLSSVYGTAEWQTVYRADPQGFRRRLVPVRIENCRRPDVLGGIVSFDLFGCSRKEAGDRLRTQITAVVGGRAKPLTQPAFPNDGTLEPGIPGSAADGAIAPSDGPIPPMTQPSTEPPGFPWTPAAPASADTGGRAAPNHGRTPQLPGPSPLRSSAPSGLQIVSREPAVSVGRRVDVAADHPAHGPSHRGEKRSGRDPRRSRRMPLIIGAMITAVTAVTLVMYFPRSPSGPPTTRPDPPTTPVPTRSPATTASTPTPIPPDGRDEGSVDKPRESATPRPAGGARGATGTPSSTPSNTPSEIPGITQRLHGSWNCIYQEYPQGTAGGECQARVNFSAQETFILHYDDDHPETSGEYQVLGRDKAAGQGNEAEYLMQISAPGEQRFLRFWFDNDQLYLLDNKDNKEVLYHLQHA
ncbi:toll/interleukin-1 receptor domain-containing protein [Frankia sp. AvcI1]|uniref:toll/interleukin-1 receptor domain-containing protein n=2 Tax=Frankia sp. AvcI1 TaxID=573496 RepID=UPI002117E359|nr:toll/interleukin-1 receptor domain-containing protein [Frankia sp. AvcI1]